MDKLEKLVIELAPETEVQITAGELYERGYEPKHRSMRKKIGDIEVCYREQKNGFFGFVALIKGYDEK